MKVVGFVKPAYINLIIFTIHIFKYFTIVFLGDL